MRTGPPDCSPKEQRDEHAEYVGMREHVRAFGGRLAAGAPTTGGWQVTAALPIPATVA